MRISGVDDPVGAAQFLRQKGAQAVIVKLGREGCWLDDDAGTMQIAAPQVKVTVDTTGAGDAFAAGLVAALLEGANLPDACREGNAAGARIVEHLGAVSAWFTER